MLSTERSMVTADKNCEYVSLAPLFGLHNILFTTWVCRAKEASEHKSDRYIWRSVKPSPQSLAAARDQQL